MPDIDIIGANCEFNWKKCFSDSEKDEDEEVSLTIEHED